jgi:hypothetical protein
LPKLRGRKPGAKYKSAAPPIAEPVGQTGDSFLIGVVVGKRIASALRWFTNLNLSMGQRIVLVMVAAVILTMCLWPPWCEYHEQGGLFWVRGYWFILDQPYPQYTLETSINKTRLATQIGLVALVGTGLVFAFKPKAKGR